MLLFFFFSSYRNMMAHSFDVKNILFSKTSFEKLEVIFLKIKIDDFFRMQVNFIQFGDRFFKHCLALCQSIGNLTRSYSASLPHPTYLRLVLLLTALDFAKTNKLLSTFFLKILFGSYHCSCPLPLDYNPPCSLSLHCIDVLPNVILNILQMGCRMNVA